MTQDELAKAAGVSQSTIGNLESRIRFSARKLAVIAKVLDVDALWLETGEGLGAGTDPLTAQIAKLTEAQRKVVASVVESYTGQEVPARSPGAPLGIGEFERRILGLIAQLDERGKVEAETHISALARGVKEMVRPMDSDGIRRATGDKPSTLSSVGRPSARRRKS